MSDKISTSTKVLAAKKVYDDARKALDEVQKTLGIKKEELNAKIDALKQEIQEADYFFTPERKSEQEALEEYMRLRKIESERDAIVQDIYIRLVTSLDAAESEDHIYKRAIKEANAYINNKFGEEID